MKTNTLFFAALMVSFLFIGKNSFSQQAPKAKENSKKEAASGDKYPKVTASYESTADPRVAPSAAKAPSKSTSTTTENHAPVAAKITEPAAGSTKK